MKLSKLELISIILSLDFVSEENEYQYKDKELKAQIEKIYSDYSRYFELDDHIYARKKEKEFKENLIKKLINEYNKIK